MRFQQLHSRQADIKSDTIGISVLKSEITNWHLILPQFTTKNDIFLMDFIHFFFQNPCSFENGKNLFKLEKKYFKVHPYSKISRV